MRARLALLALSSLIACGDPPPPADGQAEGAKLATALVGHLDNSLTLVAPYRCARIQTDRATPRLTGMKISISGATLQLEDLADKKSLTIAAIADARGNDKETVDALRKMRSTFEEEGVDLVLSLGGMASKKESIHALLGAISVDAPYLTLALPGDRESIPAHREAVLALAKSGSRIVDGSQYRLLQLGQVLVATMPGLAMSANLIAGDEGCLHTGEDTKELLQFLNKQDGLKLVLASYAPLRQKGATGSDIGSSGIHVGEEVLAPLLEHQGLAAVVHGMVQERSPKKRGKGRWSQGPSYLAAGSVDPLDGPSSALIFTIRDKKLTWWRVQSAPEATKTR